jgi:hypothetical protein
VLTAPGPLPEGAQQRLERIRTIFAGDGELNGAQKTKGRGKAQGAEAAPSRADAPAPAEEVASRADQVEAR